MVKLTEDFIMYEYRTDILAKLQERLIHMIQHHSKVLVVRFDVRFPENAPLPQRNDAISALMKHLKDWFSLNSIEAHYLWVREQNLSETPHYHVAFLINGNRCQTGTGLLQSASQAWSVILNYPWSQGLVHYCDLDGGRAWIMLCRPSAQSKGAEQAAFGFKVQAVFERLAYLAKTYSKDLAPYRVRDFGTSLLRVETPVPMVIPTLYPGAQTAV